MSIMRAERRAVLLALTTICAAGCAAPDQRVSRWDKGMWRPVSGPTAVNAAEAVPPKILPETHFSAARLYESRGLFTKAITQYRKAIAVNHSYLKAYHRLGLLLSLTGRREEAVKALSRAVTLKPNDAILRNNLGFELLLSERWAEAEEEFSRAIELKPDIARAYVNLGIVQTRLGRFEDALASFQAVLPEPDAHFNVGLMYRGQQRYSEAAAAFRYALSINPDFTSAQQQLAQVASHLMPQPLPESETRAVEVVADREVNETTQEAAVTESPPHTAQARAADKEAWDQLFPWLEGILTPAGSATDQAAAQRVVQTRREKMQAAIAPSPLDDGESAIEAEAAAPVVSSDDSESPWLDISVLISIFDNELNCIEEGNAQETEIASTTQTAGPVAELMTMEALAATMTSSSDTGSTLADNAAPVTGMWMEEPEPDIDSLVFDEDQADEPVSWSDGDETLTLVPRLGEAEEEECDDFLLVDKLRSPDDPIEGPARPNASTDGQVRRPEATEVEPLGVEGRVCEADQDVIESVLSPDEMGVCVVQVDAEPVARVVTSSIDVWAVLRELEAELTIVRNEITCLESRDEPAAEMVASSGPVKPDPFLRRADALTPASRPAESNNDRLLFVGKARELRLRATEPRARASGRTLRTIQITAPTTSMHKAPGAEERVCEADQEVIGSVLSPDELGVCVAKVDAGPVARVMTSSIDAWAVLRELEAELTIVRNEITCLESRDEPEAVMLASSESTGVAVAAASPRVPDIELALLFPAIPANWLMGPPVLSAAEQITFWALEPSRDAHALHEVRLTAVDGVLAAPKTQDARKPPETTGDTGYLATFAKPGSDAPANETAPTECKPSRRATMTNLDDLLAIVLNEIACWEAGGEAIAPIARAEEPEDAYNFPVLVPWSVFDVDDDLLLPRIDAEIAHAPMGPTKPINEMEPPPIPGLDRKYRLSGAYGHHIGPLPE